MGIPSIRQYNRLSRDGDSIGWMFNYTESNKLPSGRVDMRAQSPHTYAKRACRIRTNAPGGFYPKAPDASFPVIYENDAAFSALEQAALSRFNGRLKNGSASLGVTLASWKQSREMITHRLGSASALFKAVELQFRAASPRELRAIKKRLTPNSLASKVLEVEFGWMPLFQDIYAAMHTVVGDAIPPSYVVGRARSSESRAHREPGSKPWTVPYSESIDAKFLVSVSASVEISNPNTWLLNRLGLINPAVVAWDLVPWSFLVNMFVNVNQILESFTAHVGLDITNKSITKSSTAARNVVRGPTTFADYVYEGNSSSLVVERNRWRTVGAIPTRSLTVRVPEMNWELALIAGSLAVQQVTRISKILF
jgi:hypothetical protein